MHVARPVAAACGVCCPYPGQKPWNSVRSSYYISQLSFLTDVVGPAPRLASSSTRMERAGGDAGAEDERGQDAVHEPAGAAAGAGRGSVQSADVEFADRIVSSCLAMWGLRSALGQVLG